MKELLKKVTVILVLMMMLVNSSLLLVISSAVEAIEEIINETKINVLYEIMLEKYVNYSTEEFKGLVTQFNLKTGIEYEEGENYTPLSSTGILLNLPKVENEYPESVEVIGKSTKATNGENTARDFKFIYNKETGELKIAVVNQEDENGNIYSEQVENARDEYTIICYYSSNCYSDKEIKRNLEISGFVQANIANESETGKEVEVDENYQVTENISGLVSTNVNTTDIYDGYIKANSQNETNYKTEYVENLEIEISYKEISDEINILTNHSFIDSQDNVIDTKDVIYKSTKVNKNDLLNILGEDGFLQILNESGDILGTLNKDTEVGDNGVYEFVYENGLSNILIKTSKPLNVGTILLQNIKEINENVTNVEIEKIKTIDNISCINNIEIQDKIEDEENAQEQEKIDNEVKIEQKEVYSYENENVVKIKDSETRVDVLVDKTEWTNSVQNEVNFNVKLIANNIECKLFENPVIEIKLPSEVEKVILGESSLLYANGLELENVEVVENEDNKIIKAKLSGMQKGYYDNDIIEGAELIIPAIVILKKDISSTNAKIELKCINDEEEKNIEYDLNIISINLKTFRGNQKVEENTSVGIDNKEEVVEKEIDLEAEITATLGEKVLKEGQEVHEHEFIRYNIKIKNNSDVRVENVNVVGNVPEGTVYINNYYGEYSYDENDKYMTVEDENVKEYKETISLEAGEEKELYYWVRVNLLEDEETNKDIQCDISVNVNETKIEEYSIKNIVKKAEMELKVNATRIDGWESIWIYSIKTKNNTQQVLTNVIVDVILAEEMSFREGSNYLNGSSGYSVTETATGIQINIPVLEVGETKNAWISMYMTRLNEEQIDFELQAYAFAKADGTDTYYSNLNKEMMHSFAIEVIQTSEKEGQELKYGEEVEFDFTIKNISADEFYLLSRSLEIMNYADPNLVPISADYEYYFINSTGTGYDLISGTLDISNKNVPEGIDPSTVADLYVVLGITEGGDVKVKLKFKAGEVQERTETSNCIKVQYKSEGTHIVTSNIIKNIILPREEEEPEQPVNPDNPNDPDNPNNPDKPNNPDNPENPDNPNNPNIPSNPDDNPTEEKKTYYISGFAWIDSNKNGKYDNNESKLKDITVKLFNSTTNEIVKDNNGNNLVITTDGNGEYKFENLSVGEYLVLFEYDSNSYSVTTYKGSLIDEDKNSDVITKEVAIDGIEKTVAITDTLVINNSSLSYINMGLIKNQRFDLALNKTITKMKVSYEGFNKEYNYNDSKLVKIEIPAKKISGAKIEIEYQITITNEGDINGYVDEIADYLPEGFYFDSDLNKGWTQSNNGLLKNTSYAGIVIKPGESKTVNLYLTRTLTNNSIGTIVNKAEILKSSSINGDVDVDSINGNKVTTEDDYSEAELIIAIKTGAIVYTGIIILIIFLLILLKVFIDKKIIKKNIIKMFSIIFSFGIVVLINGSVSKAYTYSQVQISTGQLRSVVENYANSVKSSDPVECSGILVEGRHNQEQSNSWCEHRECRDEDHVTTVYYHFLSTGMMQTSRDRDGKCDECKLDVVPENHRIEEINVSCTENEHWYNCYNFIDHGLYISEGVSDGQLYCLTGGPMARSDIEGSWTYECTRIVIPNEATISEADRGDIIDYVTINNNSSASYLPYNSGSENSDYFVVGPFNFSTNGSISGYSIGGASWHELYSDAEARNRIYGIPNGSNFYVKVKKEDISITVSVNVTKKARQEYYVNGSWREEWETRDTSGERQTLGCNKSASRIVGSEYGAVLEIDTYDSASASASIPVGQLRIEKRDFDTGTILNGYRVTVEEQYYKLKKTYVITEGSLTINKLPAGYNYTITEIQAPNGYKLSLQIIDYIKKNATVIVDQTMPVTLYDRKYGDFIIKKVDQDKKNTGGTWSETLSKLEDLSFKDVQFKIYYTMPTDATIRYIKDYTANATQPSTYNTDTNINNAQIFRTDQNGQIKLINMPQYYTYHIIEVGLPSEMAQYYDIKATEDAVQPNNNYAGAGTWVYVNNKQIRVDLEGYVWEDIATSKTTTRNDLYDSNLSDKRVKDITVYLKKNGTIIAQRKTDSNGMYFFPAKGKRNADGTGNEYTIVINELSQYSIEFEYNGLKYQNVLKNLDNSAGSKAIEKGVNRANLNNNFNNIANLTKKDNASNPNKGITTTGANLAYTNGDNYNSKLVQNTSYTAESLTGSVETIDKALMLADTETAGYVMRWTTGTRVIRNINFGMCEREQPDLAIATDIDNIELTINNDYKHTYNYGERQGYIKSGLPDSDLNNGYDINSDAFSVNVKYRETQYKNASYNRAIYESYVAYTKYDSNNSNRLRFFITYKIIIKNESSGLVSKVGLRNYKDSNLEFRNSYYIDNSGNQVALNWILDGNNMKTTDIIDNSINPTECMTVYLTYEVNTSVIVNLATEKNINLSANVTEISRYSTWDRSGNKYGGIDKDSAPDNATYGNINTYEDDTDVAPALKISLKDSKEISGLVFEDSTSNELKTAQERTGSTKYESGEKGVQNVDVKLISYANNDVAKLYKLDNNGNVVLANAQTLTNQNGEYTFVGMVPGSYYIQYTYGAYNRYDTNTLTNNSVYTKIGDKDVTTESYKSTIVNTDRFRTLIENNIENPNGYNNIKANYEENNRAGTKEKALWYWYQKADNNTYSSAVDNSTTRNYISNQLSNINYQTKTNYDNIADETGIHSITANTGAMDFAIEDYRMQITDTTYSEGSRDYPIYFGIVERPRQSVKVDKKVKYVKITLAGGQVLIEGDPRKDKMEYVTYPENIGILKIEVDNEIIEGATLDLTYEITITNKSELDYNTIKYYRYGEDKTNLVKMKMKSLVDYADEKLSVTYNIGEEIKYYDTVGSMELNQWYLINGLANANIAENPISIDVFNAVKNRKNILVEKLDIELDPITNTETKITLSAKKLLTNLSGQDQIFDNYVELLNVSNSVGRFYGEIDSRTGMWKLDTPGNFNVYDKNTSEIDNNDYTARTTIVPPTGIKTIIIYLSIGIICLTILAGGIVLIKQQVL